MYFAFNLEKTFPQRRKMNKHFPMHECVRFHENTVFHTEMQNV